MGIKKFESFTTPYLPGKPLSIEDVTDEMIDTSLTHMERLIKDYGKSDIADESRNSQRYQKLENIKKLVQENFINLLHSSLSRNDKEFLKKAVKFLQENS